MPLTTNGGTLWGLIAMLGNVMLDECVAFGEASEKNGILACAGVISRLGFRILWEFIFNYFYELLGSC